MHMYVCLIVHIHNTFACLKNTSFKIVQFLKNALKRWKEIVRSIFITTLGPKTYLNQAVTSETRVKKTAC
jgi:hypothetical protein